MSKPKKHPRGKDDHNHRDAEHGHVLKKRLIHHDWRFWVAIVLMGMGMFAYILSFDESIQPEGGASPEMPAAAL